MNKHPLPGSFGGVAADVPTHRPSRRRQRLTLAGKRLMQFIARDTAPKDLLWLSYVLGIAPWAHRAARPLHEFIRWDVGHSRQKDVDRRIRLLRARMAQHNPARGAYRVSLAQLCPDLEDICRPMRRAGAEIPLATIDQDGFLCPRFARLWDAPQVSEENFLPRDRFDLTVVDANGWVGVRKNFRGDKVAFANELEASLDLTAAGCNVPPVFTADFERVTITSAYIDGVVVREALAQAGAPLRDRDRQPGRTNRENRRIYEERCIAGRQIVESVLGRDNIARIGEALLAIHRAGYTLGDVKYGNIIIENATKVPYFVDCERALPLRDFGQSSGTYLRDRDVEKLNDLFGTELLTSKKLRKTPLPSQNSLYSPFYAGSGHHWGAIWNPDLGVLRWRHMLAKDLPIPRGGRILDLGANAGFNALQMLRAGAHEVVGVEIDPDAIRQGLFIQRVFEWADNTKYHFSYVHGSHGDVGLMNLGRFDMVTAFCTLYYLSDVEMAKTVADLGKLTDMLVLQCNEDRSIERNDPETFLKASRPYTMALLRDNGFPNITLVERRGSGRPLLIARTR